MKRKHLVIVPTLLSLALAGCTTTASPTPNLITPSVQVAAPAASTPLPEVKESTRPATITPLPAEPIQPAMQSPEPAQPTPSPTQPVPTLGTDEWKNLPVISPISARAVEIYRQGVAMGSNPTGFSKVGDCGGTTSWFLSDFDHGPNFYRLGEYNELEPVIEFFQGSHARSSLAAKAGFNAASLFSPLWANRQLCQPDEGPLACEYRTHRPSIAFIMIGSNDVWHQDSFDAQMRRAIEFSIENGVLPVLSTKADNLEGDGSINLAIARLAQEYQIPLINYWAAVQPLPARGLQDDGVHLTWAGNRFDDPQAMQKAWPWRNLTTLQMLDAIWSAIQAAP